jgi:ferredoxin
MDFIAILGTALSVGAVAAVLGILLSIAAKLFAVKKDDPADESAAALSSDPHLTAVVHCSGGIHAGRKYRYEGLRDCVSGMALGEGAILCPYGCLGLGTCIAVCPSGAISIRDGAAMVDQDRCTSCFQCISACPRKIIRSVPYVSTILIPCLSHAKGAVSRTLCNIGCLGCRLCLKSCRFGAVSISENLASIDYDKCTGCGDCAEKCPRKLIVDLQLGKSSLPWMEE